MRKGQIMNSEEKIIQIAGIGEADYCCLYGLSETGRLYVLRPDSQSANAKEGWSLVTKGPKPIEPVI